MTEMLLFGAGASIEAGVPGAYELTKAIVRRIRDNPDTSQLGHVISFVVGGLLFEAGQRNQDPLAAQVNVEALFNAVQLLSERNQLEASPFVGSWHSMVEEFDRALPSNYNTGNLGQKIYEFVASGIQRAFDSIPSSFDSHKIDGAIQQAIEQAIRRPNSMFSANSHVGKAVEGYVRKTAETWQNRLNSRPTGFGDRDIQREVEKVIDGKQTVDGQGDVFRRANEEMIAQLKNLVWLEDANKTQHLRPILSLLKSQGRLAVATLNYDNCVELLAAQNSVDCTTGIEEWAETGEFAFEVDSLCLMKLHGSIDWIKVPSNEQRKLPHTIVRKASLPHLKDKAHTPAVIFGQRNKLTADGPFLDLLRQFREELGKSTTLTVVGYSFGDPHINVFLTQWLNAAADHVIRIVNGPIFEENHSKKSVCGRIVEIQT